MADSSQGGLFGLDPDLVLNMGLGLLSAGGKNLAGQGNIGQALQGAVQNTYAQKQARQQLGMGNLQMQQLQQEMPLRMDWLKQMGQFFHSANNDPNLGAKVQGLLGAPDQSQADMSAQAPPGIAAPVPMGTTPQPHGAPPPQQGMPPAQMPPQQGGMSDPMRLLQMAAGGESLGFKTGALQDLAKTQLQYDPAMATRMEAAKSSIAVDQQMIQAALGRGDTAMAAGIAQKMRQDLGLLHIASMSGTQTRIGLGGDISTFNPNEGVQTQNGIESAIPGAAGARGEIEGAIARGRATGETIEVTGPDGAKYTVPKSVVTGGGGASRGTPAPLPRIGPPTSAAPPDAPSLPPSAPGLPPGAMPAGLPPAKSEMLVGNAKAALATNDAFQTQAESSKDMLAATQTLLNSANDFTPGRFADSRGKFMEYANSLNLLSPEEAKALGSKQEGDKIAIQLQAAATKQLGSREAAQIFDKMGKSLPNLTLSQDGLSKVSAWMMGISRYNIARAADANTKAQAQDATGVNQVRDTWIKNSNPLYYVVGSAPPSVREEFLSSMKDRAGFVKGWAASAKAGYAPRPGDYSGGP